MFRGLVRRTLSVLAVLPVTLLLVFLMLRITGNPIENAFGDRLSPEEIERRISLAGLDKPIHEQFVGYVSSVLSGDFGETLSGDLVSAEISKHLAASVEVVSLGLVLLVLAVLIFGGWAARKPKTLLDKGVSIGSIVTYAMPGFLGATIVKELSNLFFPSFQTNGRLSLTHEIYWQSNYPNEVFVLFPALIRGEYQIFFDAFSRLLLPAIVLGLVAGTLVRTYRDSMSAQLKSEPIQSAINRGIPERRVFWKQAFLPSLPPVLASFGITAGSVLTGVVFIESIFEIRGLGYLLIEAVLNRDFMLVQGIFTVSFFIVVIVNFLVDLVVVAIDKRQIEQLL